MSNVGAYCMWITCEGRLARGDTILWSGRATELSPPCEKNLPLDMSLRSQTLGEIFGESSFSALSFPRAMVMFVRAIEGGLVKDVLLERRMNCDAEGESLHSLKAVGWGGFNEQIPSTDSGLVSIRVGDLVEFSQLASPLIDALEAFIILRESTQTIRWGGPEGVSAFPSESDDVFSDPVSCISQSHSGLGGRWISTVPVEDARLHGTNSSTSSGMRHSSFFSLTGKTCRGNRARL